MLSADGQWLFLKIHTLFNKENISERTIMNTKANGNQVRQKKMVHGIGNFPKFYRKVRRAFLWQGKPNEGTTSTGISKG